MDRFANEIAFVVDFLLQFASGKLNVEINVYIKIADFVVTLSHVLVEGWLLSFQVSEY